MLRLFRNYLVLAPWLLSVAGVQGFTPAFRLADTENVIHNQTTLRGKTAAVFVFLGIGCPISNSYAPLLRDLCARYSALGVAFFGVLSDPTQSVSSDKKYVRDFGYKFPVLIDEHQSLARQFAATTTPEAIIIDPNGAIVYSGRIDNRYVSIGKTRYRATQSDLEETLAAILSGAPLEQRHTTPVGCAIPFVSGNSQ